MTERTTEPAPAVTAPARAAHEPAVPDLGLPIRPEFQQPALNDPAQMAREAHQSHHTSSGHQPHIPARKDSPNTVQ